jgi:glucosamine-6-phosphate deaminase
MKVLICDDAERATARAAQMVIAAVVARPATVLGLATGGTMLPLYARLVAAHAAGAVGFSQVTTFNLDEYIGLSPDHPCSYHAYMRAALFDHVDIDLSRTHLPRGDSVDPVAESQRYEALIAACGGIDLQVLGIGRNGHIGFNEPTSSLGSRTRIKTLTASTRAANAGYFDRAEDIPAHAITMGIRTILEVRHCLLLATGAAKAPAVAAMVEGPLSAACPASALQMHPAATVVLDRDAARDLRLHDYYHHVHPGGAPSVWC